MESDIARFIGLATRRLDDNLERKFAAETELRKSLEQNAPGHEAALVQAVDSLERADKHPRRGWWRFILLGVTLAVSVPLLVTTATEIMKLVPVVSEFTSFKPSSPTMTFPRLDPQQRLLLFGADGIADDRAEKWRPLWQSDPENPVYLAEYALAYSRQNSGLSPEILEAAERIDPDNGWFQAQVASAIAEGAVSKVSAKTPRGFPRRTPVWKITNRARLDSALAAIHELVGKHRFTAYRQEIQRERISMLPPVVDIADQIQRLGFGFGQTSATIALRKLTDVLSAGAQVAAAEKDVERFRRIVADWRDLSGKMAAMEGGLVDGLIAKVIIIGPAPNFRDTAHSLGLAEEEAFFSRLKSIGDAEQARRAGTSPELEALESMVKNRGSFLTGMFSPMVGRQVKSPPSLTESDLAPGRYADHALLACVMAWTGWLLLGICAGAAVLSRFVRNSLARRLAERMWHLLRPADWALMIFGGVALPVASYLAIIWLTPLSSWEWSAGANKFLPPAGQFGAMVVAMILLPVTIASARLAIRGAALGLKARFPWLGWVAVAAALAAIPAFGGLLLPGVWGTVFQKISLALGGAAVSWLFAGALMSLLGRSDLALRRATLARVVWPAWVAGMLALAALTPIFHARERHWIQQDRLLLISAESPMATLYEQRVTEIMRAELREMLDSAESGR